MIHYLYVGHFERDDGFIRFEARSESKPAIYDPVIQRPIEPAIIKRLISAKGYAESNIPDSWSLVIESGYITWDRFCGNVDAADFIVQLARETGCDLADYSSLSFMDVEALTQLFEKQS